MGKSDEGENPKGKIEKQKVRNARNIKAVPGHPPNVSPRKRILTEFTLLFCNGRQSFYLYISINKKKD